MKQKPFYFEVKDVLTQFVAAFNDVIINRYNSSREVQDRLHVRYVYSPKQRALHNLLNKSQHITLPAVVFSIGSISRDEDRVFNKLRDTYAHHENTDIPRSTRSDRIPPAVPINIDIDMSIMAKYQNDVDQIVSNFVPYSNPYIVVSWKLPSSVATMDHEIRTEIDWSGSINFDYPTDINADNPARISADTSFTIKGWMFPASGTQDQKNILYIDTTFVPVTGITYL